MSAKSQHLVVLRRRQEVCALYVKGWTQSEIANRVGCSITTVCQDLQSLRRQWQESAAKDFAARQSEELARLDHLERVAWQAWERSCQQAEVKHKKKEYVRQPVKGLPGGHKLVPVKVVDETTLRGQVGDPRFLDQVRSAIELRMKTLGLLRTDNNISNVVTVNWDSLVLPPSVPDTVEEELIRNLPPTGPGSSTRCAVRTWHL